MIKKSYVQGLCTPLGYLSCDCCYKPSFSITCTQETQNVELCSSCLTTSRKQSRVWRTAIRVLYASIILVGISAC